MIKLLKAWIRKLKSWLRLTNQLQVENLRLQRALAAKDRRIDELMLLADKADRQRHTMSVVLSEDGTFSEIQTTIAHRIGENLMRSGAIEVHQEPFQPTPDAPFGLPHYVAKMEFVKKEAK